MRRRAEKGYQWLKERQDHNNASNNGMSFCTLWKKEKYIVDLSASLVLDLASCRDLVSGKWTWAMEARPTP